MEQEKSQLKIGIVLSYINMGLGNLIPVFYTPVMLALLGQSEYGLYKLSSGVTSYLSLISMGIGSAVTRYLIKAKTEKGQEEEERVLALFMVIFQIIALASLIVGTVLTFNLQIWYGQSLTLAELSRMRILVFIMVCNTALSFSQSPYYSVVSSHEKFVFLQCINIVSTCVGPLLNLLMLFMGFASIGMALSSLAISVFCRTVYSVYTKRTLKIRPQYKNLPIGMLREILQFSFWIFVGNIVGQLYNSTDTVMIGAAPALATVGTAVYNVGATFNGVVFSLTTGVSSLLAPKTNRMVFSGASDQELTDLSIKVGRLQGFVFALVVTGFIAFGQPFIFHYVGADYSDAYWVAILMMVPNVIPLVQSVCSSVIIAQNRHKFRSLVYLCIAIINVVGTWFLMNTSLGVIGAALMTGVALIIGQGGAMNWYYQKKTGLQMERFWKETGRIFLIPICMCALTLFMSKIVDFYSIPIMLMGIIVYTIVYCILCWKFVMNSYEKGLVLDIRNKIIKR